MLPKEDLRSGKYFTAGNVAYLESSDVESTGELKHKGKTIVLFQANYCPHCTVCKPDYAQLGEIYKDKGVLVSTIQMDGSEDEKNAGKKVIQHMTENGHTVSGYPTFAIFNNGKIIYVPEGRDLNSLTNAIEKTN